MESLRIIQALSCPTRLSIYASLGSDGLAVGKVAQQLGVAQSTASYHLQRLRSARLVDMATRGRTHIYRWTKRRWYLVAQDEDVPGR